MRCQACSRARAAPAASGRGTCPRPGALACARGSAAGRQRPVRAAAQRRDTEQIADRRPHTIACCSTAAAASAGRVHGDEQPAHQVKRACEHQVSSSPYEFEPYSCNKCLCAGSSDPRRQQR
ncbi:hypothetical protein PVAP13_J012640 [Panicum virgatum]|nr:hypothetical protein PVAP13_J012640 [Panicum virgatum]